MSLRRKHIALDYNAPPVVSEYLLDKFPEAAKTVGKNNWTSLHYACIRLNLKLNPTSFEDMETSMEIIKKLSKTFPAAMKTASISEYGDEVTPFHLLFQNKSILKRKTHFQKLILYMLKVFQQSFEKKEFQNTVSIVKAKLQETQIFGPLISDLKGIAEGSKTFEGAGLENESDDETDDEDRTNSINLLKEKYPKRIQNIDDFVEEISEGLADIHKAAVEGNFEQVKKYYDQSKESIEKTSSGIKGLTPLHLACNYNFIQQVNVSAIEDAEEDYDLIGLVLTDEKVKTIKFLCEKYPEAINHASTFDGMHLLLKHEPSFDLVKFMLENTKNQKELLNYKTEQDLHPLHLSISDYAPPDVILFLLDTFPEAAKTIVFENFTALHYACERLSFSSNDSKDGKTKTSVKIIKKLSNIYPEAMTIVTSTRHFNF